MLNELGIRGRLLLVTLIPSVVLASTLGFYFTRIQFMDIHQQLYERGQILAEQLAPTLASLMVQGQEDALQRLLNYSLNQPDLRTLSVLGPDRNVRAHVGPNMLTASPPSDPLSLTQVSGTESTRLLMPLLGRHLSVMEDLEGDETRLIGWLELELSHEGNLLRGYRSLFTSLILIAIGLSVTASLAIRMSSAISRPLLRIKGAVNHIKEGRLETRLPPLGSHEMDELASGINGMAEALRRAQEELQQSVEQATEDVHQNLELIEIQNIELDLARKEALIASRMKSEFLANISHEIRTPLNGILGFTHLLQKEPLTPHQHDHLLTIERSANNLLGIINEILDFSKIEAGKLTLECMPFQIQDLIEETLTIQAPSAHTKNLELACFVYRDVPKHLMGDPMRIQQVLTNLISNAIKFTAQGSIVVRVLLEDQDSKDAHLRITVQDTGVGLNEREIHQLFQPFTQADNSLSRQPGGTGLGLAISKRLIEQMRGEIGVSSTPGEGSCFWIALKLPKTTSATESSAPRYLGLSAALFEPQTFTNQALHHQLEDLGFQVKNFHSLHSLCEAVRQAQHSAHPYQLALLDHDLLTEADELLNHTQQLSEAQCVTLLLCDQIPHHRPQTDLAMPTLAKPVCGRKLQQVLGHALAASSPQANNLPAREVNAATALRVLCVDDNHVNLRLLEALLTDMGVQVTALDSGYAALEAVYQQAFDLVFMDMQMPEMDGQQTTAAIRQWETARDAPSLPIIAITAHALSGDKRLLLQNGLDDYLIKPINASQLAKMVLKWTGLSLERTPDRLPEPVLAEASHRVLDQEEGLRLAAGKADLAQEMLHMLFESLPTAYNTIHQAHQTGDRTTLVQSIHHLHGATQYCGVPQLRHACRQAETLLKMQHPAAEAAVDSLEQAIQLLMQEGAQHEA